MIHLDLFSGVGVFSLGLERAGMKTVAYCEIDKKAQLVLKKNNPGVPVFDDVTKLCRRAYDCDPEDEEGFVNCPRCQVDFGDCECIGSDYFLDDVGEVDIVTAGFPCQDVSYAGDIHNDQKGVDGERSGLYREAIRIVRETGARWIIFENVSALVKRGLNQVLEDLAEMGFDAEWHCVTASLAGGWHRRERIWIIAYDKSLGIQGLWPEGFKITHPMASPFLPLRSSDGQWKVEPDFRRTPYGSAGRVDRLKQLGNAVVPQVVEAIGRAIMEIGNQPSPTGQ